MTEWSLPENYIDDLAGKKLQNVLTYLELVMCRQIESTPMIRGDLVELANSYIDFIAQGNTEGLLYQLDENGNIIPPCWPPALT